MRDGHVVPPPHHGSDGTTIPPWVGEAPASDLPEHLLGRADALNRQLLETVIAGGALGDLCTDIAEHIGAALFATTTDGRVLAKCGDPVDLAAADSYGCFDRTGRFLVEHEPLGPRRGGASEDGVPADWCRRMVIGIWANDHDLGRLVAVSAGRDLGRADVHLLERAARIAALALTKDHEVATVETKYRAEFLRDVLVGRAGAQEDVLIHANALGWDVSGPLAVVVAEIDTDEEKLGLEPEQVEAVHQRFAAAWMRTVRLRAPQAPCVGFGHREVVTLLPAVPASSRDSEEGGTLRLVRDVVRSVRGAGGGGRRSFSTGISRLVHSVEEIPRAYEDAWAAVSIGRRIHGDGALHQFDELGVFRLLALVPEGEDLERFVGETLGSLATDRSQEGSDLRRTLGALLDTNLNIAETARQLHYHYNTVRYRIAKLERTVGPFTTDAELRLSLGLALKIVAMRGR